MNASDRYEANALIDRLVAPGPLSGPFGAATFDAADAVRLAELVPRQAKAPLVSLGLRSRIDGEANRGHAAGVGDVTMANRGDTKSYSYNEPAVWRIGGYKVAHVPGEIEIRLMWDEAPEEPPGARCRIRYRPDGQPIDMQLSAPRTLSFGLFGFGILLCLDRWAAWKRPRAEQCR